MHSWHFWLDKDYLIVKVVMWENRYKGLQSQCIYWFPCLSSYQSAREEEEEESERGEGEGEEEEDEEVEDDQSDVELDEEEDSRSSCKGEPEEERTDYSVSF